MFAETHCQVFNASSCPCLINLCAINGVRTLNVKRITKTILKQSPLFLRCFKLYFLSVIETYFVSNKHFGYVSTNEDKTKQR